MRADACVCVCVCGESLIIMMVMVVRDEIMTYKSFPP